MTNLKRGIPIENSEQLLDRLRTVQRLSKRRLTSLSEIRKGLEDLRNSLSEYLYKKDMVGLVVSFDPNAQSFPASYKYTPYGTKILAKCTSKGWSVIEIARGAVQPTPVIIYGLENRQEALASFITKRLRTGCTL